MPYSYITLGELRAELLNRLQDSGAVYTSVSEANLYINESLRVLNSQASIWPFDYEFNFNPGDAWKTLNVSGSPRERTVTDTDLYDQMEAMLLEPMSGGTWTGTNQYNIAMLSGALQYRRDELLLQSNANVVNVFQTSPTLSMRTYLPDSTLDLCRVRWIPVDSSPIYDNTPTPDQLAALSAQAAALTAILAANPTNDGILSDQITGIAQGIQAVNRSLNVGGPPNIATMPYALGREDVVTRNAFGADLPIQPGEPDSWMITATTPPAFDVSCPPNQPGTWDLLISFSGVPFVPPTATVVGLPDDWTWVCMYGALADVLANSQEGRDSPRAKYCMARYEAGKQAMLRLPWLLEATVASLSVDTLGFKEIDTQLQDWEDRQPADDPQIVVGGVDFIALAPFVPSSGSEVSTVLTVVQNAPIPSVDSDYIQLSRDGVDAVLAYAQHVASFKMGGKEFSLTLPLYEQFEAYCRMKNEQYAALGMSRIQMLMEGNRNDVDDPRFEGEERVKRGAKAR